jgi:hypothetical protein
MFEAALCQFVYAVVDMSWPIARLDIPVVGSVGRLPQEVQ